MNRSWMKYRLAGLAGGLFLAAGNLYGPLCILQFPALLPLMILNLRRYNLKDAALGGLYMGLAFTIPQMILLRMPLVVTVGLLV
jgi:hypothetical protein